MFVDVAFQLDVWKVMGQFQLLPPSPVLVLIIDYLTRYHCIHSALLSPSEIHKKSLCEVPVPPSNSLEDIKQNLWTMKYRSLTYIYFIDLHIFYKVSLCLNVKIVLKIQSTLFIMSVLVPSDL